MTVAHFGLGRVVAGWPWGLVLGRASHMGAANAVCICISLPSWSPCCLDCQHPYFGWPSSMAWEEETSKWQCGHVTRSRWVCVGVITQYCKSRLKMETRPPFNSGLCCTYCSEVRGLGFMFARWGQWCMRFETTLLWFGWQHDCSSAATQPVACLLEQFWYNRVAPPGQGVGRTSSESTTVICNH